MSGGSRFKLAFVGNCQAPGIVASLRALLPEALVEGWHIGEQAISGEELLARLAECHVVFKGQSGNFFDMERLQRHCAKVVVITPVAFTGLHPDITYLYNNGRTLPGIFGEYNSAIIAAAYSLGLPSTRVPALFNSLVYARLGYFGAFAQAKHELIAQHHEDGYDIAHHFDRWLASGAFMHTVNHPRIDVLSTLATMASIRAGLVSPDTPSPNSIIDHLELSGIWPTYPELAQRIGTAGSTVFIRGTHEAPEGASRRISLAEAVELSYRRFAETPDLNLIQGRVGFVRERLEELVVVRMT
jgi:hypothetical protein